MEPYTAIVIFFAVILVSFLFAALYIFIKLRKNLENSASTAASEIGGRGSFWKAVKGKITESRLDYKDTTGTFNRRKRLYRARFTYQYYAYDRMYTHSSLTINWSSDKQIAADYVKRYPVGSEVTIHFHPEHPEQSVMEITP